jgi:hypothetical protein
VVVDSSGRVDGTAIVFRSALDRYVHESPGGAGDMLKADYASVSATKVNTALNAEKLGGSLPAAYDQSGEAAAAVAAHDLAFDHANLPSAGEKGALPGTSGAPGAGNKYVTDADARNSDARTPTAHTHPWVDVTGKPAVLGGDLVFRIATGQLVSHDVGAPLAHGAFPLDAGAYATGTWTFRMVGWVSGPTSPLTARVRLWNLTDGEYVTDADVETTATSETLVTSAALTVGSGAGDLQDTAKLYEVHMEIEDGAFNIDTAHFGSVELVRT